MTKQYQKGFTLVELAIVLTIIGLLIGGILKGQQLMQNARVTATIAQVNAIEAATTTFRDTYNAMPGDMRNADTRIPDCGNCIIPAATAGDSHVGAVAWTMATAQGASPTPAGAAATVVDEATLFWAELAQTSLLGGVSHNGGQNVTLSFSATHPAARVGGGFIVGNANGVTRQPAAAALPAAGASSALLDGTVLALVSTPTGNLPTTTGSLPMTPTTIAQMDRKMDDGNAMTGTVQAFGFVNGTATGGCLNNAAVPYSYNESVGGKNCGGFFRIQN